MRQYTWDDILFFLAVARTGQLSSAARQLRTNHATVSRRIDRLEDALSARLFERNRRGYVLTPLGERLIELAEAMERDAEKFHKEASGGAVSLSGVVRLSTLEGFGNFFLADRLPALAQQHPNLSIEVVTIQQIVSLSRREADVSITLGTPRASQHHQERITPYRLFFYGSQDYLDRTPPITRRDDLKAHPFIGYIDDMVFTPGLDYLREIFPGRRAGYQASSIQSQLSATRLGFGLCVLPYFIAYRFPDLVPVLPKEIHLDRDYWLICHNDVAATPRVRTLTDFIKTETRNASHLFLGQALLE